MIIFSTCKHANVHPGEVDLHSRAVLPAQDFRPADVMQDMSDFQGGRPMVRQCLTCLLMHADGL